MNFGIIEGEDSATYHASDAVGSHKLQDLSPYPVLFYRRWVSKLIPPEPQTPALAFGQYFHTLALEGEDAIKNRYIATPNFDRRTTAGKESYAKFLNEAAMKTIVHPDDISLAWRMVKSIRDKPSAVEILSRGKPEVTFRKQMEHFAIQARADWFDMHDPVAPLIVDLKSIESLGSFDKQFFNFDYYKQAAFYRLVVAAVMGLETFQPQFCYIVVEKSEPFQCAIRVPDAESLAIGTKEVMAELTKLKNCYASGEWPGEPDEARPVSLPEFKVRQSL